MPMSSQTYEAELSRDVRVSPQQPITTTALLTYLRSAKEFELYYYLFNQVEVVSLTNNSLEISRSGSDKSLNNKLVDVLSSWNGGGWGIVLTDIEDPISLKEQQMAKFVQSEEWQSLQLHFPDSKVTDILLA